MVGMMVLGSLAAFGQSAPPARSGPEYTGDAQLKFPEHYRGGIFALDWTFGKIYFFHLDPDGSSYKTKAEVFLEPAGINGFAPTDACVAPDGSLFISIGGRGTRGASSGAVLDDLMI